MSVITVLSYSIKETEIFANTIATMAVRFRIPDLLDNKSSIFSISLQADRTKGFESPGKVKIWKNSQNPMTVKNWPYW